LKNIEKVRGYYRKSYLANIEKKRARVRAARGQTEAPTRPLPDKCENPGCRGTSQKRRLAEDHDPKTGKFRGWLCGGCNTAIGTLGDNVEGVEGALTYLRRTP
jgi:hypothetical protein